MVTVLVKTFRQVGAAVINTECNEQVSVGG